MKVLVLSPANENVKNVVRDFMYGCWCRGRRIGGMQMPPLNLLYVSTVLQNAGHEVSFVDAGIDRESYNRVKTAINEYKAVIILTSTNSFSLDIASLRELKELNEKITTIVVGSHPTFMPEYCLAGKSIDIIVQR